MNIEILRLGHRPQRDKRITTHVCLTARAMGAKRARISEEDANVVESVSDLSKRFGGDFAIEDGTGWKGVVKQWKKDGGQVVHLTMYGRQMHEAIPDIKARGTDVLVVVGAEKVPGEIYKLADENLAVGNQPHSEVAALALVLDRLRNGQWEQDEFEGGDIEVIPTAEGKTIVEKNSS